ncbi:MAG: hypothetical protein II967_00840 [Deltaproteobacteria bacterium]|nr:hypothetical protein [Deltaproteobacteria bacterium]
MDAVLKFMAELTGDRSFEETQNIIEKGEPMTVMNIPDKVDTRGGGPEAMGKASLRTARKAKTRESTIVRPGCCQRADCRWRKSPGTWKFALWRHAPDWG